MKRKPFTHAYVPAPPPLPLTPEQRAEVLAYAEELGFELTVRRLLQLSGPVGGRPALRLHGGGNDA